MSHPAARSTNLLDNVGQSSLEDIKDIVGLVA